MIRSQGRKKSNFPALDDVPEGATFDFVSGGVNYKIPYADFLTALNVIGTIVQSGPITGVPVLDPNGSESRIRNIVNGPGVVATVGPENGIILKHNFTVDNAGAALVVDPTAQSPIMRSIVAGLGISVSTEGNRIQIAASGEGASSRTVVVNSIADFPAPVAGVITLENNTDYLINNNISTSNRFVLGTNNIIRGVGVFVVALEYTGSGALFTGADCRVSINNVTLNAASGTIFDVTGPLQMSVLVIDDVNFGPCLSLGTVSGTNYFRLQDASFTSLTNRGILFQGLNRVLVIEDAVLGTLMAGTLIDLGTATFDSIIISGFVVFNTAAGTVFLGGTTGSGNINAGGFSIVNNNRLYGLAAPLSNITSKDLLWRFTTNDEIVDTSRFAIGYLVNNTTETAISVTSTPVKVAGTWVTEDVSYFTFDATGRATYTGTPDIYATVSISLSPLMANGGDNVVRAFVAVNGTVVAATGGIATVSASQSQSMSLTWHRQWTIGDFVELFVQNDTSTTNIIVQNSVLRVST